MSYQKDLDKSFLTIRKQEKSKRKKFSFPKISRSSKNSITTCSLVPNITDPKKENDSLNNKPLDKFRRAVKRVLTLLLITTEDSRKSRMPMPDLLRFDPSPTILVEDKQSISQDLSFNLSYFKVNRDISLNPEARRILSMPPQERTDEELHTALVAMKSAVQSFAEFPKKMQQSLIKVGWYESYRAKRVIIREGHNAENFYLIISGTSVVFKTLIDDNTSEVNISPVAFLKKGNSFGELALIQRSKRSATVVSKEKVELLAVGREDFKNIFMHKKEGGEPEFIQFLKLIEDIKGWPIEILPYDDPSLCIFTFFRRGTVVCRNSETADWIYIIKSGTCRVLKVLTEARPEIKRKKAMEIRRVPYQFNLEQENKVKNKVETIPKFSNNSKARHIKSKEQVKMLSNKKENEDDHEEDEDSVPIITNNINTQENRNLDARTYMKKIPKTLPSAAESGISASPAEAMTSILNKSNKKQVFVQLHSLKTKDIFGLAETIRGVNDEDTTNVTLVSDGAECILISKRFFIQNLSDNLKRKLSSTVRSYPSEQRLQERLQEEINWQAYKSLTIDELVAQQHHTF